MPKSKINIHFLSAECYPCAKVGGLADVVGSLPKYLNQNGCNVEVFIPYYDMPWFANRAWDTLYEGSFVMGNEQIDFAVVSNDSSGLGFQINAIQIPGKFDRYGVYADTEGEFFSDEVERYIAFQTAYLQYVSKQEKLPQIIHPHDHHMGLVPFLMNYSKDFSALKDIPTVFTIHNQRYQGAFDWSKQYLLPEFDTWKSGMLDWADKINPLASAVKCSWKLTTVSPSYMQELKSNSFGLEWLFNHETPKSVGILNGIDDEFWDPKTDDLIEVPLKKSFPKFKQENKKVLLADTKLKKSWPLISFIGRFALEKGADLLPEMIEESIDRGIKCNFLVLGTGDKEVESRTRELAAKYPNQVIAHITYNEALAHQVYAGSDFLIMPSRVEPCGLNQMYAMRYGTVPIVSDIGGLRDSIKDVNTSKKGTGIKLKSLSKENIVEAITQATEIYQDKTKFKELILTCAAEDFSWHKSAKEYLKLYRSLLS